MPIKGIALPSAGLLENVLPTLFLAEPVRGGIAPKFDISKVELRYLPSPQVGRVLAALKKGEGYYERLSFTLATALFLTATRFQEWAGLERERLLWGEGGDSLFGYARKEASFPI